MSLTALIAELFVGGVLCLTWLLLIVGAFVDIGPVLTFVKDNPLVGTLLSSVVAYAVGVVFDRAWDWILNPLSRKIEREHFPDKELVHRANQRIFGKEKDGADFVNYVRSRMRIARAVVCNGLLITGASLLFYVRTSGQPLSKVLVTIVTLGMLLCLVSFGALQGLTHAYYKALKVFTGDHREPNKAPEPTSLPVTPPAEPGVAPGSDVAHL